MSLLFTLMIVATFGSLLSSLLSILPKTKRPTSATQYTAQGFAAATAAAAAAGGTNNNYNDDDDDDDDFAPHPSPSSSFTLPPSFRINKIRHRSSFKRQLAS